ncbi:site-specific integrase [Candidatus Bathyarchaeota archaeon]|nr:site-specific integrase [Candidatus Bathyarchaeota archaeon]
MSTPRTRGWYWKAHGDEYTRASVGEDVEEFVGWDTLMGLVEECERSEYKPCPAWDMDPFDYRERLIIRDQALIAALFLTGGRVSEVVGLRVSNFEVLPLDIRVKGMAVLKRYKKIDSYLDEQGRKRFVTEKITMTRGTFSISRDEPLVPYLLDWIKESEDYLFPSPSRNLHLCRQRAYQIVTSIGDRVGVQVWNHWFRSQRASQLATEYSFDIQVLADWFKWSKLDTARIYTKLDPSVYENIYAEKRLEKSLREQLDDQAAVIKKLLGLVPVDKLSEVEAVEPSPSLRLCP